MSLELMSGVIFSSMDPCSFYIPHQHTSVSYPRALREGDASEAVTSRCVFMCVHYTHMETRTVGVGACRSESLRFLTSNPFGTYCHSLFLTLRFSHLFVSLASCIVLIFLSSLLFLISNLISIISPHPCFCTRLPLIPLCLPAVLYNTSKGHIGFLG